MLGSSWELLRCLECKDTGWNPVAQCERCGSSLQSILKNPSDYQKGKCLKHGLVSNGTQTSLASPISRGLPASKFNPGTDILRTVTVIASSGSIVISQRHDPSLMFRFDTVIGSGYWDGQFKNFSSVHLVKPVDRGKIHAFPDEVNPKRDLELICRRCGKSYAVAEAPTQCSCGFPLPGYCE